MAYGSGPPRPPDRGPYNPPVIKRTTSAAGGWTPPATPPWQGPTPAETMAQAQALAQAQMAPQYQSIADQQAYAQAVYQSQIQRLQAIGSALGGFLGGIGGPVTSAYKNASKSQLAFGKGFSDGMQMLLQGQADTTNSWLGNVVGAPQGAMIPSGQASDAGAVLMGVGGTIPSEMFKMQGKAAGQYASEFPKIATAQEHVGEVQAQQDYQERSNAFAQQLQELARQNPVVVAQFLNELYTMQRQDRLDYYQQIQDQRAQATDLYNNGMITQRELARQLGLNPAQYPNTVKGAGPTKLASSGTPKTGIILYDPYTGAVKKIIPPFPGAAGPPKPPHLTGSAAGGYYAPEPVYDKSGKQTGWQWIQVIDPKPTAQTQTSYSFQNINGRMVAVDPKDPTKQIDLGKAGTPQSAAAAAGLSKKYFIWNPGLNKGKGGYQLAPGYHFGPGSVIVADKVPGKAKLLGPDGLPYGQKDISNMRIAVTNDIARWRRLAAVGKAGPAELAAIVNHWKTVGGGIPDQIWVPIYAKTFGIPRSADDLKYMPINRLHAIAVAIAPNDFAQQAPPQHTTKVTVTAGPHKGATKTIHGYTKNELIQFITAHMPSPKAEAAAETAADVSKWVYVPSGVDRPGVPTHPQVLQFVAQIAQVWGKPLTIGTGSGNNHKKYVKGEPGVVSAHWTGWAVDIPIGTGRPGAPDPMLTKLGQDALIAAGMPEAQARKVTHWDGGDYNGYNILFNTNIGGNHFNHLHVGLRATRQTAADSGNYPTSVAQAQASPASARATGKVMAAKYGWTGREWSALDQLWHSESSWDYTIHNKEGSGAVGIPQYMPSAHGPPPGDFLTNPITQIKWGLDYIKNRYKTPSRAWAFWRATVNRNASLAPPDLRSTAAYWISKGWGGY